MDRMIGFCMEDGGCIFSDTHLQLELELYRGSVWASQPFLALIKMEVHGADSRSHLKRVYKAFKLRIYSNYCSIL